MSEVVRRPGTAAAVSLLLGVLLAPAAAHAQALGPCSGAFKKIVRIRGAQCGTVPVPLDRTGGVPGQIGLRVARIPARTGASDTAVVVLAGGPGQAALPFTTAVARQFAPELADRDLIVFDQRGTGVSDPLRCHSFDRRQAGSLQTMVASCASELGSAGGFYRSIDSADDIDAVRQAAGVEKLTVIGTSYGTTVALLYAQRHPEHVERLVLDSPVPADGGSPFQLPTMRAVSGVVDGMCGPSCRAHVDSDPVGDLRALVSRIAQQPFFGNVVGATGRPHRVPLLRTGILGAVTDTDLDPVLRALVPGALRAAARGDAAPLLRLTTGGNSDYDDIDIPLYVATSCTDVRYPWDVAAAPRDRAGQALTALTGMPDAVFGPFDRATALAQTSLCWSWPNAPTPDASNGPLPDVPVLVLSGSEDVRAPTEQAAAIAASFPRGTLVVAPRSGHDVIDSTTCGLRAVRAFFADRPPGACPPHRPGDAYPVPPLTLREVKPLPGISGQAGRTAAAIGLTANDADVAFYLGAESGRLGYDRRRKAVRIPGLRSGRIIETLLSHRHGTVAYTLHYDRNEFIPGVRLDGTMRVRLSPLGYVHHRPGALQVRGALHIAGRGVSGGTVRFANSRRLEGRLGGRHVRFSTQLFTGAGLETQVSSSSTPAQMRSAPTPAQMALRLDPDCCG
jgi:pimeloyl-ACP methyl ester carboxylesterase